MLIGFSAFIKSPNNYGLLIDIGAKSLFSPNKWLRKNYNSSKGNIKYFRRRNAKAIITHLHYDHFEDIRSVLKNSVDKPKILLNSKNFKRITIQTPKKSIGDLIISSQNKLVISKQKKFQAVMTKLLIQKIYNCY